MKSAVVDAVWKGTAKVREKWSEWKRKRKGKEEVHATLS